MKNNDDLIWRKEVIQGNLCELRIIITQNVATVSETMLSEVLSCLRQWTAIRHGLSSPVELHLFFPLGRLRCIEGR
jgi:hypothetical protein